MMTDSKILQFITSSVNQYFTNNKGIYNLFLEGQIPDPNQQIWAELTSPGVRAYQYSGGIRYETDLHIMCGSKDLSNLYNIQKISGYFQSLMGDIQVLNDSNVVIGCLTLREQAHSTEVINWGRVQFSDGPALALMASVHGYYKLDQ